MTTTPMVWPYPPRDPSGDWGVTLPGNASIGEVKVWAKASSPPPSALTGYGSTCVFIVPSACASWISGDAQQLTIPSAALGGDVTGTFTMRVLYHWSDAAEVDGTTTDCTFYYNVPGVNSPAGSCPTLTDLSCGHNWSFLTPTVNSAAAGQVEFVSGRLRAYSTGFTFVWTLAGAGWIHLGDITGTAPSGVPTRPIVTGYFTTNPSAVPPNTFGTPWVF